jgi:hypothetical protein
VGLLETEAPITMIRSKCKTCYFYGAEHNVCKIRAPVALIVPAPEKKEGFIVVTAYPQPPLKEDDWCGEHAPESMGLTRH